MKQLLIILILATSVKSLACGGDYYEWMSFYTLFNQKNISDQDYKPFLRDANSKFYDENSSYYYNDQDLSYHPGNVKLWTMILDKWTIQAAESAVYNPTAFNWQSHNGKLIKRMKVYVEYANFCSDAFSYRTKMNSWNYEEIQEQNKNEDIGKVLKKGVELFSKETNEQLKSRYAYQIIRILHYSKKWEDAIAFYNTKVKGNFPKNEMYYYTIDQVAGCYYSIKEYDQAAFLFTKVVNHSIDRKKSAYISFEFCKNKNFDGKPLAINSDDKKDYQFIKSLGGFADEIKNMTDFIKLDANDDRIEVLFARSINKLESEMLTKNYGTSEKIIPYFEAENKLKELLNISKNQSENSKVKNTDFWLLTNSYLSFLNQDFLYATSQLDKVKSYTEQKSKLAIIYEVFQWDKITPTNEAFLTKALNQFPEQHNVYGIENDFRYIILDYVAHRYYKNNQIAKSFLVHNYIETADDISSLSLINDLESFYKKSNKSDFEKILLTKVYEKHNFIDYVNHLYGVYYLYQYDPFMSKEYFDKCKTTNNDVIIPNSIFSNNTIECFSCDVEDIMQDEVYKADVFSFIKRQLNLKELTNTLIELEQMTKSETAWKAKLANYLLGNYYFNLSNTGYYRGALTSRRGNNYSYFNYDSSYDKFKNGDEIIEKQVGYNLTSISYYPKNYHSMSLISAGYYKKVIDISTDRELNARCLYLIAKCELNQMYNGLDTKTYEVKLGKYYKMDLPLSNAFYELKHNYSDTKFHDMIIKECGYFKYYSDRF